MSTSEIEQKLQKDDRHCTGHGRKTHLCLNLRGAITNFKKKEWRRSLTREDGSYLTPDECYQALLDELSQGRSVIPFGECDNFDYQKGCLGHPYERVE